MARGPTILIDRLPACPTGASMMPLVEKLRAGPCKVTLEGSRVEQLDASGLEALLVIAATQRARGDPFELEAPSEALTADLSFYGVSENEIEGPN